MRYETAVRHLRAVVDACARHATTSVRLGEKPLVVEAHAFGKVLEGPVDVDRVQLALVLDLPVERVTWYAEPREAFLFAEQTRIDRLPVEYYCRPAAWPVWNHHIRGPVALWSIHGGATGAVDALAEHRFDALLRALPSPRQEAAQREAELAACERHLRAMLDTYWEQEWRRAQRWNGLRPEDHLWRAAYGYFDVAGWSPH